MEKPVVDPEKLQQVMVEIFVKHRFEFPTHWVMLGVNGSFFTGKFELSFVEKGSSSEAVFKTVVLSGRAKDLRFPINMMLVDRAGKAALTLFTWPDVEINLGREPSVEVALKENRDPGPPNDDASRFLSTLQAAIRDSLDLKRQVEEGRISPEEGIKKIEALGNLIKGQAQKLGLPGEATGGPIEGKKIFN